MHPASKYETEHRRADKKTSSARTRAAFRRSARWGPTTHAAVILAFLVAIFAVLNTSGSHAGTAVERTTAAAATAPLTAAAASATTRLEREFVLGAFSAVPFQSGSESVETFASDCTTPKVAFTLGDTVCVKANEPFAILLSRRSINIVAPRNDSRASDIVTTQSHSFSFTLPATAQTIIAGETFDNRGTWRADLSSLSGGRRVTAFFDVSAPTAAADLQLVAAIDGSDEVNSGASLTVAVYVNNVGPDPATNVIVSPPTNTGLALQSFAPENGDPCDTTCTIQSLGLRSVAKFIATYNVTADDGTKLAAVATAESETEDPDPSSNDATVFVSVGTVSPSEECTLTCPADIVATANTTVGGDFGAFVQYSAGVSSGDCGAVSNNPAPDPTTGRRFFAVGTHTVTSTSESGGGNCSFIVKVVGTAAPTISCPANKVANDSNNSGDEVVAVGEPTFNASGGGSFTGVRSDTNPAVLDENGNEITPETPKALTDPYPVGLTSILWTVTDVDGRTASCTQTVTVTAGGCGNDTTAPTITAPDDITVQTGIGGCTVKLDDELGVPEVHDNCSVNYTISGVPAGNNFAPGTYTLTYTATDTAGNTASDTQTVIVRETSAPIIFAPANASFTCPENVPAASPSQAGGPLLDSSGLPIVDDNGNFVPGGQPYDNCGAPTVTVSQTSSGVGTPANPRIILRTYTATDASGNSASATQTITVTDGTAPTISAPANVTANTGPGATSCDTVVSNAVLGTATAQDNCAGVTVTRSPSGNTFPVGTTTVVWTATDWAGNIATANQSVTVVDNTAPVISCPTPIVLEPSCPAGAIATWTAPVGTDNCPGATTTQTAGPASGSVFPIGTTTVTYTVNDAHGNSASCSFTVTVKTPAAVVADLKVRVAALQPPLTGTQVQGLNSKLDAALSALNNGQTNVACNKLNDFISQVTAFINNGTLTSAQGQPLITSAAKVRNTIGCTNLPCT